MKVARYMQRDAITIRPDARLSAARDVMEERGYGLLLVAAEDGALKGFITRGTLKGVTDWDAAVETVSHPVRFAVSPDDTLEKAALIMLENRLVVLPVTVEDRLVGVVTQIEVLRGLSCGLGIGQEGVRLTIAARSETDDLYRAIDVLRSRGIRLVSVARGGENGDRRDMILRVQSVEDKEGLRGALEAVLRSNE